MKNEQQFLRWFGNSMVKDSNGKPLVVYHGSGSKFEEFDLGRIGGLHGRSEGPGFYFTDDKAVADGYSDREGGGHLFEAYLKIEKPIRYDQKPFNKTQLVKIIQRLAKIESEQDEMDIADGFLSNYGDVRSEGLRNVINKAAQDNKDYNDTALEQMGNLVGSGCRVTDVNRAVFEALSYDGYVSNGFGNHGGQGGTIWVAMFPSQIKSIYNRGTWNGNSNNIMEDVVVSRANTLLEE